MNKDSKNRGFNGVPFLMFIVIVFGSLWFMGKMQQQGQEMTYTQFVQEVESDNVADLIDLSEQDGANRCGYDYIKRQRIRKTGVCIRCQ